jgi:hypothetical protein
MRTGEVDLLAPVRLNDLARTASRVAQTHVSILFFVEDRVYKLKKPVSLPFLDLSTAAARERNCRREVELNRRFAPDVYLGVADALGPDGAVLDHMVVMRRMAEDRRLSALLGRGVVNGRLRAVARVVAAFHERARGGADVDEESTSFAMLARWRTNLREMQPYAGEVLDESRLEEVAYLAERYLRGRGVLFASRIANGRARDGHGDLLADDIYCLDDGPRVLDCIEFDDRLRYGDVLYDVAFLAMDLERIAGRETSEAFLDCYREFSADAWPSSLADQYVAYRALVRCKVACLRSAQGDADAAPAARDLLDLAVARLRRARVRLVLVGGLPGVGKSTLANWISGVTRWPVIRSDEVRKELAFLKSTDRIEAAFKQGAYSPGRTAAVYQEMLARARVALEQGESVVLDASWTSRRLRDEAAELALAVSADLHGLRCEAPAQVADARMRERCAEGADASDASPFVARRMAATDDPWPEAARILTGASVAPALDEALRAVAWAK